MVIDDEWARVAGLPVGALNAVLPVLVAVHEALQQRLSSTEG